MARDIDLKNKDWSLVPKTSVPGELRPGVRRDADRRQTGADLLRGQASRGDVPLQGEKPVATPPKSPELPQVPARTLAYNSPTAVKPHVEAGKTPPSPSEVPTTDHSEARAQHAENMDAAKLAARGLAQLQGGGVSRPSVPVPQVPVTVTAAFQKALATMLPGSKSTDASKLLSSPTMTSTPTRTAQSPATQNAVLAKSQAETRGTRSGDAGEAAAKAQTIAQKTPSPLLTEKGARREEDRGKIATDGPTARALANVVTGRGISAIATAQEFSAGGDGGFGDPNGESAGLAGKVGTAPQIHVYGDTRDYPETELLYAKLGLSTVLYGAQEILQRAVPIGERIANSRDDTPLFERVVGSAENHKQIAEGGRGSPYGLGKIFG